MSVLNAAENSFRSIEIINTHTHTYIYLTRYSGAGAFAVAEQSNWAILETELRLPHAIFKYDGIMVFFTPVSTRTSLVSIPGPELEGKFGVEN